MSADIQLKRSLGLWLITLYGLGNIVGAGIFVLIGEVAGQAGSDAPLSFLVASLLAALSAFSYMEMSARYPLSAGEAVYVQQGFGIRALSTITGLLVCLIGLVSAATISRGFVGYLQVFLDIPDYLTIVILTTTLGFVCAWGISESVRLAAVLTLIEIFTLLALIGLGLITDAPVAEHKPSLLPPADFDLWTGILAGGFIAFFAYLGFEDMVNVAEEVDRPERNLPLGILLALGVATLIYMAVTLTALRFVPASELAASKAPLALLYQALTGREALAVGVISMLAVTNGALIQIIMASRVFYGMSRQGWLPSFLGRINPRTRTPLPATVLATVIVLALALWFPLVTLAKATSFIVLTVFIMVNLSLWRVKSREPRPPGITVFPRWIPITGAICSSVFLLFNLFT